MQGHSDSILCDKPLWLAPPYREPSIEALTYKENAGGNNFWQCFNSKSVGEIQRRVIFLSESADRTKIAGWLA